ncbi:hypothetical protein SanaruYs_37440 [Chryseotalea sanaruensis]|uniref:Uncharacterized protein n=1 Tax=Chryseotalea sanaruensis TaxID=2482724 RepID=A0A401UF10_9BACT|nr:hypothetical protein [Chryseotalea sanaruensis]GCC53499.1 hypothetical protein SanaruYs_37440 [Chryseotalea sanaruensis]
MGIECKTALDSERLIIALISAELKSRKFFNTLQDLGLDDSWYQPHLDDTILSCLGIDDDTNETFDFYYDVMNKHAEKIDKTKSSVTKQAKAVYKKLKAMKSQR